MHISGAESETETEFLFLAFFTVPAHDKPRILREGGKENKSELDERKKKETNKNKKQKNKPTNKQTKMDETITFHS